MLRLSNAFLLTSRHLSDSSNTLVKEKTRPAYTLIYKLPYINAAYAINRMKRHMTLLSVVALPLSLILNTPSVSHITHVIGIYAITTAVLFHMIGYFCNNLIGLVYLKEDSKNIKISYLSTWGKRVDMYIDISEMCDPTNEPIRMINKFYQIIRFHSSNKILKLSVSYGQIVDKKKFQNTFGIPC